MRFFSRLQALVLALSAILVGSPFSVPAQTSEAPSFVNTQTVPTSVSRPNWLFVGFKHNGEDGAYYAISEDGYHWKLANGGRPVVPPTKAGELMRDPFIQRDPDGRFRMVWTWAWYNHTIGYSQSSDLINWAPHRELPVMEDEPTALNVWAPALYYEPDQSRWLIFWSSTVPGRFKGEESGDTNPVPTGKLLMNHRIFMTTTTDFEKFAPAKVFFDPGYSVIDATVLPPSTPGGQYTMIYKDERLNPLEKHLLTATSSSFEGPWSNISQPISDTWCEGAAIIRVRATSDSPAGYLAYYDHYTRGQHYGALFSTDLVHWTDALSRIDFPAGMRHGSFIPISQAEYDGIAALPQGPDTQASNKDSQK